jgi:hypothetical protein
MIAVIKYQVATYSGEIEVYSGEDDEDEILIARAKRVLSRSGPLPFGYQSFKVISKKTV